MRTTIAAAIVTAGLLAAPGATPASASSIERISLIATSSSGAFSAIATGAFTDGGVALLRGPDGILFLAHGTITITHRPTKPTRHVNQKTCVRVITHGGAYTIVTGTGAYAGLTGSGRYRARYTIVGKRKKQGGCARGAQPRAQQLSIQFRGPVTLAGTSS